MMSKHKYLTIALLPMLLAGFVILATAVLLPAQVQAAQSLVQSATPIQVQTDQSQWVQKVHNRRDHYRDRYRERRHKDYYRPYRHEPRWAPPPPGYWNPGYWRGHGRHRYWVPGYRERWWHDRNWRRPPWYYHRPRGSIIFEDYRR